MQRFKFTTQELIFISNFDKVDPKYWESDCKIMHSIRKKIKNYFLDTQQEECCYCKMIKQERNGLTWDVEHIFPRELYPHFSFTPSNLAVSCKECNNPKKDKDVRIKASKPAKRYPTTGSNVAIIHPHFDNYEEHIQLVKAPDGRIFHTPVNNSSKARMTFVLCNLFRFQEKAFGKENFYKKSIEKHITKTIQACLKPNMTQDEMNIAIKAAVESAVNY